MKVVRFGDIGSESRVVVECLAGDNVGRFMAVRDEMSGSKWLVHTADPYDDAKMPAVGILISKSSPTEGVMVRLGEIENQYTGLDVSKPAFVGENGDVVQASPTVVGGIVHIQRAGFPLGSDVLYLSGGTPQLITRRP